MYGDYSAAHGLLGCHAVRPWPRLARLAVSPAHLLHPQEDKPLRMVKTMLHELCKHRGYDIYKDIENMPGEPWVRGLQGAQASALGFWWLLTTRTVGSPSNLDLV